MVKFDSLMDARIWNKTLFTVARVQDRNCYTAENDGWEWVIPSSSWYCHPRCLSASLNVNDCSWSSKCNFW